MGLAQHIIRYGIVMGRAMWEASKKGINLFKKPTFTDKKRKVLDRQRKEFEADEKAGKEAKKEHDDAMRSQKSLDRFYSTPKGKKVLKELDDKRYLKKWNANNKEAVFNTYQKKFAKKVNEGADPRVSGTKTTPSKDRHLMNAPVAATALVGTGASLVHKKQSKKKGE